MCAMQGRKSKATTMGFTALDGLVMGRRCGTLDPGVILYLMQSKGMSAADIETLLYRESGLLGVSGISNNMHDLELSSAHEAQEAINLFVSRAARTLTGLIPTIGGLDAVVFTAGIGENSAPVRAAICAQLNWLGLHLDQDANAQGAVKISAPSSAVDVLACPRMKKRSSPKPAERNRQCNAAHIEQYQCGPPSTCHRLATERSFSTYCSRR